MGKEEKQPIQPGGDFNYEAFREQAIARMLSGDKELTGKDGLLAPLLKDLLDAALSGEMQAHVEENRPNRRNGSKGKSVKTAHGPVSIEMPRDRNGTFEPKLIAKRQTTLGEGLDNRILSLYSKGLSYEDIQGHLEELYGLEMSTGQLSAITDKILPVTVGRSRGAVALTTLGSCLCFRMTASAVRWMRSILRCVRMEKSLVKQPTMF